MRLLLPIVGLLATSALVACAPDGPSEEAQDGSASNLSFGGNSDDICMKHMLPKSQEICHAAQARGATDDQISACGFWNFPSVIRSCLDRINASDPTTEVEEAQ